MTVSELKARSRKTITSQHTGMVYRIRSLSQIEFTRAQLTALMPAAVPVAPTEREAQDMLLQGGQRILAAMQWVIEHGVVDPKIRYCEEDQLEEGQVHSTWIGQDEGLLYSEILQLSGLDDESQKSLENFLKNRNGSEPTTPSEESTESFQAHSSSSHPSN